MNDLWVYIIGIFSVLFLFYIGFSMIFRLIKFDQMLIRGSKFFVYVLLLVAVVPFALTFIIGERQVAGNRDLIYSPDLYRDSVVCHTYHEEQIPVKYIRRDSLGARVEADTVWVEKCQEVNHNELDDSIKKQQQDISLLWTVYYHFIDPGNQHMTASEKGRFWAGIIAVLGVVLFNGLLVSTIVGFFDSRKVRWINGNIRYSPHQFLFKHYAVVIGANASAPSIIKKLLEGKGETLLKDTLLQKVFRLFCPCFVEKVQSQKCGFCYKFLKRKKEIFADYVILLTNDDIQNVRKEMRSHLNRAELDRLIIYSGQLDSIEEIYQLHLEKAIEIYILGEQSQEDISESYHDIQNMKCVHHIAGYLTERCVDRRIVCRVLFEFQTTYSVFQFSDLPVNVRQHLVFIPFNAYENWAERVFVYGSYEEKVKRVLPRLKSLSLKESLSNHLKHCFRSFTPEKSDAIRVIRYKPLDGDGITPSSQSYVHLVIVGMSKMGISLAIQAAQLAHFPNFKLKNDRHHKVEHPLRTRITFIDEHADEEMLFFQGRFQNLFALSRHRFLDGTQEDCDLKAAWIDPLTDSNSSYSHLGDNFLDIEWEFVKGHVGQPSVVRFLKESAQAASPLEGVKSLLTIAVCLPQAHEAIASSIYMPAEVYDYAQQILVYQREASEIVCNLSFTDSVQQSQHKRYQKLAPFGMVDADFSSNKEVYYSAQLCNHAYSLIFNPSIEDDCIPQLIGDIDITDRDGDMKLVREAWKKLPIFHKWSNKYLANSFKTKVRSIGADVHELNHCSQCFAMYKVDMAECEHNRWNMQQLLMGFRAYKNNEIKTYLSLREKATKDPSVKDEFSSFKAKMKGSSEKIHLNICSFEQLKELDRGAQDYDIILNNSIPSILKVVHLSDLS